MNEQNFANHGKIVPVFHYFVVPALVINLVQSVFVAVKAFENPAAGISRSMGVIGVLVALALLTLAFLSRIFALGVQDRVIRLEERLRYQLLLPEDLKPRIGDFTINQLVSLRFASDEELPVLARKVFDGKVNERKAIKQMIQTWRADYQRI